VRDRVNVPRDMSLWAARRLREALEMTASLAGSKQGPAIPLDNRRDQNPVPFRRTHHTTAPP
jgi:glutathione S-transferase